ncbi:MAG: hypothetical protein OJJ54_03840 [Pseudonocardia sp.]|nr:hypothetical protein [Pseudonocardia sp.]
MSVVETVLTLVVPPVALYAVIALLVMAPKRSRRPRYRSGQEWPFEPLFWTANPEGAHLPAHPAVPAASSPKGGARGHW